MPKSDLELMQKLNVTLQPAIDKIDGVAPNTKKQGTTNQSTLSMYTQ